MKISEIPINIINMNIHYSLTNKKFSVCGFLSIRDKSRKIDRNKLYIEVNGKKYSIKFPFKRIRDIRGIAILSNFFIINIPIDDLLEAELNNRIHICYSENEDEILFSKNMRLTTFFRSHRKNIIKKMRVFEEKKTTIVIKRTNSNSLIINVREINRTDYGKERIRIFLSNFLSKFYFRNICLMYEKKSEKYEESASVLYEKLIDYGYKNIYYIIDKNSTHVNRIPEKYKKNIVYKYTFKHYLYFFAAKTFIGTEMPGHLMELRSSSKIISRRLYSNKFKYVFLQHGVMYMVSLDSSRRGFFRKGSSMPDYTKIVVSSEEEAKHFIELGGYEKEDLYITGMPKFDRNIRDKDADRIVIMPTWRPWEYNIVRNEYEESGYYKMVETIFSGIPDDKKDKVVIMPHPLIKDYFKKSIFSKYMLEDEIYDNILRKADILITDYSSVAYDAFYRGANIIFYWKDKDECMENYGGHLMLNRDNVFGKVCYTKEDITNAVNLKYGKRQEDAEKEKYRKIVEFYDGKNTERLIECLKKDNIIKK